MGNNKAKLTYPVALITQEELYALTNYNSSTYYSTLTNTGERWWGLSLCDFSSGSVSVRIVLSNGNLSYSNGVNNNIGVRPVVSLAPGTVISSGTGSITDPWIVEE